MRYAELLQSSDPEARMYVAVASCKDHSEVLPGVYILSRRNLLALIEADRNLLEEIRRRDSSLGESPETLADEEIAAAFDEEGLGNEAYLYGAWLQHQPQPYFNMLDAVVAP